LSVSFGVINLLSRTRRRRSLALHARRVLRRGASTRAALGRGPNLHRQVAAGKERRCRATGMRLGLVDVFVSLVVLQVPGKGSPVPARGCSTCSRRTVIAGPPRAPAAGGGPSPRDRTPQLGRTAARSGFASHLASGFHRQTRRGGFSRPKPSAKIFFRRFELVFW